MAGSPDLSSTMGIWLLSVFLEALLQGMGMLQCFLYFVWYHRDPCVLECIQMGASFGNVYTCKYLAIFVAQVHFARCVYHLQKENIILPAVISLLSLLAVGAGLEYSKLGATKVTTNLQAGAALAADALITFGLCWRLNEARGGIQSTNKILNFLIMTAVNRGVFTVIFAALNIILFFSRPGTFDFMLVIFISDKFYMNSMLAMLNTREYAVHAGKGGTVVQQLSLPVYAANPNITKNTILVSTSQQIRYDESYVEMGKVGI
ncbi:hypothetical protein C8J57DRAFT_1330325 [Mycena rebaudengoi]|nr:hypothetical protein C8J57DRAFT_1330325 [Mycena rebaudengoi]